MNQHPLRAQRLRDRDLVSAFRLDPHPLPEHPDPRRRRSGMLRASATCW
ncbi:MAG TPA: hypothetical protein VHN14_12225 [Kofleriaceae bacterium]|nr:hypothetical protein [Kofleriaceae bacterium]